MRQPFPESRAILSNRVYNGSCSPILIPGARLTVADPLADAAVQAEREALTAALLQAAARLARGQDAEGILRPFCEALVAASRHIRLAWMWLGPPDTAIICPIYAVGPAEEYARALILGADEATRALSPGLRALASGSPVMAIIRSDPAFAPWRDEAVRHGLEVSASFPFGEADDNQRGLVAIYADQADYFTRLGLNPFVAFQHLAQVALTQAALRERLNMLATLDCLTGLLNRGAMQAALERYHAHAERRQQAYCLLLLDIDRFKLINDGYGHGVGDGVIRDVAKILQELLRAEDRVGRWGGEEFLCLLPDTDCAAGSRVAEDLRARIMGHTFAAGVARTARATVSLGLACFPTDGDNLEELLNHADMGLYEAKRDGRNRLARASDKGRGLFATAQQLEIALASGQVRPAYQPIVALADGRVVAKEALARIVTVQGVLEAQHFIEAADRFQWLHRLDHDMICQVIEDCATSCKAQGPAIAYFVNVSTDLLHHPDRVQELLDRITHTTLPYADIDKPLVIEITERQFLGDFDAVRRTLAPFLAFGIRLALDDFGSGYSSFRYLAELPFAFVKLDHALVNRVQTAQGRRILRGLQDLAADLGFRTIAEGVEDEACADALAAIGIDWAQGYYFAAPRFENTHGAW